MSPHAKRQQSFGKVFLSRDLTRQLSQNFLNIHHF